MRKYNLLRILELCLFVSIINIIAISRVYAYIDPGTGSFVLQAVAAGVLAAAFVVKSTWKNIKGVIGRISNNRDKDVE